MTHPFHPLLGREYELIDYRHFWGEDRVVYVDETGKAGSFPARWTSAVAEDPAVAVSAGRWHFRVADLVALQKLVEEQIICLTITALVSHSPPADRHQRRFLA